MRRIASGDRPINVACSWSTVTKPGLKRSLLASSRPRNPVVARIDNGVPGKFRNSASGFRGAATGHGPTLVAYRRAPFDQAAVGQGSPSASGLPSSPSQALGRQDDRRARRQPGRSRHCRQAPSVAGFERDCHLA